MGHVKVGLVMGALQALLSQVRADESLLTRYEFEQIRFAAPVRLTFYASSEEVANQASKQVFDRLKALDRIMSDYDPDSELMQLCATSRPGKPVKVSDDLFAILSASQRFSEQTEGAFDVTVGPIVKLWRIARRRMQLPAQPAIDEALARTGWQSVKLDEANRTVELKRDGMQLDLGGIAQGYAADEGLRILNESGINRAMVDVSGDIRLGDSPPGEPGWRIAIQALEPHNSEPPASADEAPRVVVLSNAAVSTSGDAYQYVEIDGVRYSHIVDPKTGLGMTQSSSVTVIAPDAMTADVLDTALSVQGPERGLESLKQFENVEAIFAWTENGELKVRETSGFGK